MNKFLCLAIVLSLPIHAFAQTGSSRPSAERVPADPEIFACPEIHYAGVYHVASGVFEPASNPPQPAATPSVIYDNSCKVAGGVIQSALNGSTYIDDGRIPSTTSPSPNIGMLDHYRVNKLQISYAVRDVTGSPFSIRLRIWDHFFQDGTNCTSLAAAGNPLINYTLNNLPGATVQGQLTGYVLDVDLIGTTQFCMSGDANGVFDGDPYANGFGYGLTLLGQSGNTPATTGGFFITGLASGAGACGMGEGTYFNNPSAAAGTGLDDDVTWYRDGQGGQSSGCFTFSGNAAGAAGFWLVMWADVTDCTSCPGNPPGCGSSPGVTICEPGTAGVIACPCANPPANSGLGCNNSSSTGGAHLAATGVASLGADTLVFTTSGEKPTATSIVLQGDDVSAAGNVFGQGVNCVAGNLVRLYLKIAAGGSITAPQGSDAAVHARSAAQGDTIAPGTRRYYGVYYRDATVLGGCPAASTFNITHGLRVFWQS